MTGIKEPYFDASLDTELTLVYVMFSSLEGKEEKVIGEIYLADIAASPFTPTELPISLRTREQKAWGIEMARIGKLGAHAYLRSLNSRDEFFTRKLMTGTIE